eukprot:1189661-Prorocentrum_minimum.AAC.5
MVEIGPTMHLLEPRHTESYVKAIYLTRGLHICRAQAVEGTATAVGLKRTREAEQEAYRRWPKRGEQWEKVGNWTQGEKRGSASGVLRAPLPLLAQEEP